MGILDFLAFFLEKPEVIFKGFCGLVNLSWIAIIHKPWNVGSTRVPGEALFQVTFSNVIRCYYQSYWPLSHILAYADPVVFTNVRQKRVE